MGDSDHRPDSLQKGDEALDALLARGRFGGPDRERILLGALRDAQIGAARGGVRRFAVMASSSLAAAAVVALAILRPWRAESTRPKGAPNGASVLVSLECMRGSAPRCANDTTLLFRIEGARWPTYLFAYAEGVDGSPRIWFFSPTESTAPNVQGGTEREVLRDGIRLDSLSPGHYDVHVVMSPQPLTRSDVLTRRGTTAEHVLPLEVTR